MELYAVRINGLENPVGYAFETLLCSWKVRGANGKKQAAAKIQVGLTRCLDEVVYEKEAADLNSMGEQLDLPLAPYTRYYYQITITSDEGETARSEVCYFETAKLGEPWTAKWIGAGMEFAGHPEFHKSFSLKKEIACARLYICGLGLFEAYINGEKAGDDLLAPFINDYQEHLQYCAYDITGSIQAENEIRVLLGNGWYRGKFGLSCTAHPERPFSLIAELRVEYTDGSVETVGTDESWHYRGSVFEMTDIYDGETQNYQLWQDVENPWRQARALEAPAQLTQRYSPPVQAMETLPVLELIQTPAGETVLDFGQNFAGYVEFTQPIPKGQTVVLEFGEILQNGNFYHANYRTAKSVFTYISDGGQRAVRPYFTFFGFRYVMVSGLESVDPACFTGHAVYSKMDRTGWLETGNEKINRLYQNSLWGLKSNFLDMPTDCPQRDERLGWTGDAQVFAPTAGYHMDTRAFYTKFLKDLRSDQLRNDGRVAIFLPNEFDGLYASVWSDIATFLPNMLYTYYGSKEQLAMHYPLMKDWVDCIQREDAKRGEKHLYDFGFQFGDWLAQDGATEQSKFGRTDSHYISSVYYYASTSYVAEAAEQLGYDEAVEYRTLAADIRQAILDEYFTKSGRLAIDTQTGYLVALRFGVYMDKQRILDGLKARIKNDCNRIKGGFVGATMMNTVLAENGLAGLAYDFLFFEGFPGWLYAVNLGATTIWERWNSVLPDGSLSGTEMNSLNHYSYGAVVEFLYRNAAGISPLAPGFKKARIAPLPDARLGKLACSFDSAGGKYVSNWCIEQDGRLSFHIEIPFGCEAELVLPEQESSPTILQAGSYDYSYKPENRDYRALYSETTTLDILLADPAAVAVLKRHIPGVVSDTDRTDVEAMSKSLQDMRNRALLFRSPADDYSKAIKEIRDIKQVIHQVRE